MATHVLDAPHASQWARIGSSILHEIREVIPPTLFFFVGFSLIRSANGCFSMRSYIRRAKLSRESPAGKLGH